MTETAWPTGADNAVRVLSPGRTKEGKSLRSVSILCGSLVACDAAMIFGCSYLAFLAWLVDDPYSTWPDYELVSLLGAILTINVFHFTAVYRLESLSRLNVSIPQAVGRWMLVAALLIAVSFLTKTSVDYSRLWSGLWFSLTLVSLVGSRWFVHRTIRRWAEQDRLTRNVAVIGAARDADRLARELLHDPDMQVRLVGLFSSQRPSGRPRGIGLKFLGDLHSLERYVRANEVDTVIVVGSAERDHEILSTFGRLRNLPVEVLYCPTSAWFPLARPRISKFGPVPMMTIFERPLSDWRMNVKDIEDYLLAGIILILIAPVMAVIALCVKLDSRGPVFFRQKRYGFNNQLIEVFKFRTMHHDLRDPNAEQLTRRNDPRVTRVGAFLRKWSLDELPQFLNVLRGEMSIVGPRPHAISAKAAGKLYADAVRQYASRHRVRPGITGWAQINGWRGETDTVEQIRKRVEHDLIYIDNWSLSLDLRIIFMTIVKGFGCKNAV